MNEEDDEEVDWLLSELLGENEKRRRGLRKAVDRSTRIVFALGFLAAIAMVAVAALLFTQTLTAPTVVAAVLTRNCEPVAPTPPNVIAGTSGFVTWRCSVTQGAITVGGAGTVTPSITRGAEWTTTYIWKTSGTAPTTSCSTASINKALTSGTSVSFVAGDAGEWNFCSDFVNAPNPMSNVVYQWSQ